MEKLKHTPGPWEYLVDYSGNRPAIKVKIPMPFPRQITLGIMSEDECPSPVCCKTTEHANAKLIAAAPELLELALMVHRSFGGGPVITFSEQDISEFERVVKKATE